MATEWGTFITRAKGAKCYKDECEVIKFIEKNENLSEDYSNKKNVVIDSPGLYSTARKALDIIEALKQFLSGMVERREKQYTSSSFYNTISKALRYGKVTLKTLTTGLDFKGGWVFSSTMSQTAWNHINNWANQAENICKYYTSYIEKFFTSSKLQERIEENIGKATGISDVLTWIGTLSVCKIDELLQKAKSSNGANYFGTILQFLDGIKDNSYISDGTKTNNIFYGIYTILRSLNFPESCYPFRFDSKLFFLTRKLYDEACEDKNIENKVKVESRASKLDTEIKKLDPIKLLSDIKSKISKSGERSVFYSVDDKVLGPCYKQVTDLRSYCVEFLNS